MRLKRGCSGIWIAALAAVADRISKALVTGAAGKRPLRWPGLVNIRPVANTGVAFSMFSGSGLALTVVTALLIVGLAAWLMLRPEGQPPAARIGLWMVVGGGLGNLYDRVVYGHVIDFIELDFVRFAVFNVADVAICLGAAVAAVAFLLSERKKESGHA